MHEFPTLFSKRLVLNQPVTDDIPVIVSLLNVEEFSKYTLTMPYPYLEKDAKFWFELAQKGFAQKNKFIFAIRQKNDPKIIGGIDLSLNIKHNKGELGYWLGLPYWNKGYMTEAAKTVVQFGFGELGLKRIFASHFTSNPASGRVMQKVGMQKEGVLKCYTKKGDVYQDHVVYGVINSLV
ncbi:MAG TPA: N-acetyltransferase [Saprospiraceae bacterium]|nr:N-acetyltransferase [Saprospiraceae bacterium]